MAFTVAQLTAIEDAIASGSLEVTFDGKTIKYASAEDLMKRYNFIKSQLVASGDVSAANPRTSVTEFTKD